MINLKLSQSFRGPLTWPKDDTHLWLQDIPISFVGFSWDFQKSQFQQKMYVQI